MPISFLFENSLFESSLFESSLLESSLIPCSSLTPLDSVLNDRIFVYWFTVITIWVDDEPQQYHFDTNREYCETI